MDATLDPKQVSRIAWQAALEDGLTDVVTGIYLVLLGLIIKTDLIALIAVLIVFVPPLIKKLKARLTYPRLGYVAFPEKSRNRGLLTLALLAVALLAIILLSLLAAVTDKPWGWNKWLPLLPAILFLGALLSLAVRSGIRRYYLLAGLALVLGVVFTLPALPGRMDNLVLYLFALGGILAVWGAILLISFLRKNPLQAEETRDGE